MTPMRAFCSRNAKETLRDPLNMMFTLAFPLVLLYLMTLIQSKAPSAIFPIGRLAPGMAIFGLAFISLNIGLLLGKDRQTSFLSRLFTSPLRASDFILGYTLPQFAIALAQTAICFAAAFTIGLAPSWNVLWAYLSLVPTAIMFIGFGMLFGTVFTDSQVGGIFGLFINVASFTCGLWIPLELVGGVFADICYILPFAHAFDMTKGLLEGDWSVVVPHIWWVLGYTVAIFTAAIICFKKKMKA